MAFARKFSLQFPLLADPDREVIEAYGAWGERERDGEKVIGLLRSTFIIGKDGLLKKVYPQVVPKGHSAEILADLDRIG